MIIMQTIQIELVPFLQVVLFCLFTNSIYGLPFIDFGRFLGYASESAPKLRLDELLHCRNRGGFFMCTYRAGKVTCVVCIMNPQRIGSYEVSMLSLSRKVIDPRRLFNALDLAHLQIALGH